jgi:hypothetical protein
MASALASSFFTSFSTFLASFSDSFSADFDYDLKRISSKRVDLSPPFKSLAYWLIYLMASSFS